MSFAVLAILFYFVAALGLGLFGHAIPGARANLLLSLLGFLLTLLVFAAPGLGAVHADSLGVIFGVVTGFVGLTTAAGNLAYVQDQIATTTPRRWRLYHALFQATLGLTLLGFYADNLVLLWAAMAAAMVVSAFAVSLPRSVPALRGAWRTFVLGSVGLVLALFGTLLTYLAAAPALGPHALSFVALGQNAARLNGPLLALGFVFLLLGYGSRAALAPLLWLPAAAAQGPAPLTASLSVPLLNVALLAILRFSHLLQGSFAASRSVLPPSPFLLALGLVTLLLAGIALMRRRDARAFFAWSSVGQSGLVVFAFGIGGGAAIFGALLQMILATLLNAGVTQALTRAAILRGGAAAGQFGFRRLAGIVHDNRLLGWLLGGCIFALAGLPPSGLFVSQYLIVSQTLTRLPWLAVPLLLGLLLSTVMTLRTVGPLLFGPAPAGALPRPGGRTLAAVALHLLLGVALGYAMPTVLVASLSSAAAALQ